ncbi:hypothetical protein PMAYCL1PPCAC_05306, partial [Pristionchus mayeri]
IRYWITNDLHLLVEYCKSFPVFNQLSKMDKMVLLSHMGGLQVMLTQAYYSVTNGHGSIVFPDKKIALDTDVDNSCRQSVSHL